MFGNKPKVSDQEFKDAKQGAFSRGVSVDKLKKVENIMHGHLDESGTDAGIDKGEMNSATDYIQKNKTKLGLTDKDIKTVEEEMKKRL